MSSIGGHERWRDLSGKIESAHKTFLLLQKRVLLVVVVGNKRMKEKSGEKLAKEKGFSKETPLEKVNWQTRLVVGQAKIVHGTRGSLKAFICSSGDTIDNVALALVIDVVVVVVVKGG